MSILEISHLSVTLAFIAYTVIQSKWDKLTHERLEELTQRSNVLTRIVDTLCMQYDQVVVRKAAEEAVKWDVGDEMKTIVVPIVGGNGELFRHIFPYRLPSQHSMDLFARREQSKHVGNVGTTLEASTSCHKDKRRDFQTRLLDR